MITVSAEGQDYLRETLEARLEREDMELPQVALDLIVEVVVLWAGHVFLSEAALPMRMEAKQLHGRIARLTELGKKAAADRKAALKRATTAEQRLNHANKVIKGSKGMLSGAEMVAVGIEMILRERGEQ